MTSKRNRKNAKKKQKVSHFSPEKQNEASYNTFSQILTGKIKKLHILYEFNIITNPSLN
jgi:hypothetical protein